MAHLKIDLENDNLLYYSRLLAQLAMIEDIAGGGDNPNLHAHRHDSGVSADVTAACGDAHLHLTDGEPPLPEIKPHVPAAPFNPFAGQQATAPLAPPAPPAPLPAAAGAPVSVPAAPTATLIDPPPPPGAPSAPSATTTAPVPAAATPDLAESAEDSEGLLWDSRIHSGEKGKKVDGTWKLKRGIDKDYAASVLAELRAASKFPGTSAPPTPPMQAVATPPAPPAPVAPPAPPAPQALTPPVPTAVVEELTFKKFMEWVLVEIANKRLTKEQLNQTLANAQLPAINQLNTSSAVAYLPQAKAALELAIVANSLQ